MLNNTKRGERALFWMKMLFCFFVVILFVNDFFEGTIFSEVAEVAKERITVLVVVRFIFQLVISIGFLVTLFVFFVTYFSWLHRAITNLRILTKPDFSPIGSIILTCIPLIGFIFHFWIFNDMAERQQMCMQQRGILKERFPKNFLIAWFFATLVFVALALKNADNAIMQFIENMIFVASVGFYIRFFMVYIKQERKLFRAHSEDLFRRRVDEILRERESIHAANQLRNEP